MDSADTLPTAPDVPPGFCVLIAAGPEVHLRRIALRQIGRIESRLDDGWREIVAMHAGEQVRVDDVVGGAVDDHLLIAVNGPRLLRRDEGRADIGEIGAHGLGAEDRLPVGDGARQGDGPVKPFPDLLNECEGRQQAGMSARARRHGDQAVCALLHRLVGEGVGDHIVHDDTAIGMYRLVHFNPRAERGDDDRDLVFHTKLEILLKPVVRPVDDLVHRKRRRKHVRMRPVPGGQLLGDLMKPLVKQGHRTCIQ